MKKLLIFLVFLAIGFWGYYYFTIEKQNSVEKEIEEKIRIKNERKKRVAAFVAAEKKRKRQLKNLCEDLARRTTLEIMQNICPVSGKKSNYKLKKHHLNQDTNTLIVDIHSEWWGKNHIIAEEQLHSVDTRLVIFGSDSKTYLEITDENEIFKISKQNHDYEQLAKKTLDLGLTILNEIQETFNKNIKIASTQ